MEITHRTHNLRIAPRKLRLVSDAMRHQKAEKALATLPLVPNKGAGLLQKSLKSAIQVALDNNLDSSTLTIQRIWCDEGMKLKRMIGNSHGRMTMIMKKYSHLTIVLQGDVAARSRRATKVAKPAKAEDSEVVTSSEEK